MNYRNKDIQLSITSMDICDEQSLSRSESQTKEMLKSAKLKGNEDSCRGEIFRSRDGLGSLEQSNQSYNSRSTDYLCNLIFAATENERNQVQILSSKKSLKRMLGVDNFENQKTLKQNMEYLKENYAHESSQKSPEYISDNFNIINRNKDRGRSNGQRVEYREKLEEEKAYHKKSKSHRGTKYQYIRNNHDIITRHQRNRSTDSSENSILQRSNGFEILFQRGEKIEKLIGNYDSYEYSHQTSYQQDLESIMSSDSQEDSSSSISNIENSKAFEISYKKERDLIEIDQAPGKDTKKSLESVLNFLSNK